MHPFQIAPSPSRDLSGGISKLCLLLAFTWTPSFSSTLVVAQCDVFWSCWGRRWPSFSHCSPWTCVLGGRSPGVSSLCLACGLTESLVMFPMSSLGYCPRSQLLAPFLVPCPLCSTGAFVKQFFLGFTYFFIAVPWSPVLARVGLIDGHRAKNHSSEAGPLTLSQTV